MDFFESVLNALSFLVESVVELVELGMDFLEYLAEAVAISSTFIGFIPSPLSVSISAGIAIAVILKIISVKKGGFG